VGELCVGITVGVDGDVEARRDFIHSSNWKVRWDGVDRDLVRTFERWITLRDHRWEKHEIAAFGGLLHRCLFAGPNWSWVERQIDDARSHEQSVRLELAFPFRSGLASMPWEYLCRPEGDLPAGEFLAAERGVVLVRRTPPARFRRATPMDDIKVLVVVSAPKHPALGPVEHVEVLERITQAMSKPGFTLLDTMFDPTAEDLRQRFTRPETAPDVLHFIGHGQVLDDGVGQLAFRGLDDVDWVDDSRFAEMLARDRYQPRGVVLHSCDAGHADFVFGYGGVAPQLAHHGVQVVVAMQYPVTNATATDFSSYLYDYFAEGWALDRAAQEARYRISEDSPHSDARLVGVPVIYAQGPQLRADVGGGEE
jgi:hypothetical protein